MSRAFRAALWALDYMLTPGGGPPGGGTPGADGRLWFSSNIPAYVEPAPTGSGQYRNVANYSQWVSAKAAAQPGDVIRITAQISGRNSGAATLAWGPSDPTGTATNPITVTCTGSGKIVGDTWTGTSNDFPVAFDLVRTAHVHLVGNVIESGRFGLRCIGTVGTAASPVKLWHNSVLGAGEATLYVGSLSSTDYSAHVSVRYNTSGASTGISQFNEGIYVGTGSTSFEWQDKTHDVEVAYNNVYGTRGDGIDLKLGIYNIDVHHNWVHDCGTQIGSGIGYGAGGSNVADNPTPTFDPNITIRSNWVWNIGYAFGGVSGSSYGINCSGQGVDVFNNVIWNLDPSNTSNCRGINSVSYINDGTIPTRIFNNTVWVSGTALVAFTSGGNGINRQYSNNITADGSQGSTVVTASNFVGPVPTANAGPGSANELADSGNGPGSAFIPLTTASNIVGQASGTTPALDITGVSRPQGGASERGAYELVA